MDTSNLMFPKPKDLKKDKIDKPVYYHMKNKSSKRAKATDIPMKVKKKVYERDNGLCIICGKRGAPNSHYISRNDGGLGIPENVVTMCENCHHNFDNGKDEILKENIRKKVKKYLKRQYGTSWNEEKLIYRKGGFK